MAWVIIEINLVSEEALQAFVWVVASSQASLVIFNFLILHYSLKLAAGNSGSKTFTVKAVQTAAEI